MILDRQRSVWGDFGLPRTGIFPKKVVMMAAKLVLTVHPFKRSHSEMAILERRTQRIDGWSSPHLFSLGSRAGPWEIETRQLVSTQIRRIWANIENPGAALRQHFSKFRLGERVRFLRCAEGQNEPTRNMARKWRNHVESSCFLVVSWSTRSSANGYGGGLSPSGRQYRKHTSVADL